MDHYWLLEAVHLNNCWLTIGSFDGVHLGHQSILKKLTTGARKEGVPAVVVTFHPHPAAVLRNRKGPYYLTTPEEQAQFLAEAGADVVITHPFNLAVSNQTAREFVQRLNIHLQMRHLCVGHDFALGHGREGDLPTLERLGGEFGYSLEIVPPVELDGQVVSSSLVRNALSEGDLDKANTLLGRPFQLSGNVIHGDGRGRRIGVPTANLHVWEERALPRSGVYACRATVDGRDWKAVINVGFRPTFDNQPVTPQVEAHLLDFSGDLYHQRMQLAFLHRLRDERRFPSIDELVGQIQNDISLAREVLETKMVEH
jgi:riboflavin kinase / FMN adenylyltransferase